MKNIILGSIGALLVIYTILIGLGVYNTSIRYKEMDHVLGRVLKHTLENGHGEGYSAEKEQQMIEEIEESLGSDSDVEVEVHCMDLEKGIISVTLKETFLQVNGKLKTCERSKTVIMDREKTDIFEEEKSESAFSDWNWNTEAGDVYEGACEDAYTFYNTYGNRLIFVPVSETDGEIYCATKAKRTSSSVLFSTIGWMATVRDTDGSCLQTIYYQMGGAYLKTVNSRIMDDGYEYVLYSVSFDSFRSRLKNASLRALESGNYGIFFDACIVIKRKGIAEGGMTDAGIDWGTVYTAYDEITRAEDWSPVTKLSLLSYFDKKAEGLDQMFQADCRLQKTPGEIRFISLEFFMDEAGNLLPEEAGGLSEDSVWRQDKDLQELLRRVLNE